LVQQAGLPDHRGEEQERVARGSADLGLESWLDHRGVHTLAAGPEPRNPVVRRPENLCKNPIDSLPDRTRLQFKSALPRLSADSSLRAIRRIFEKLKRKVCTMKAKEQFALALRIIGVLGIAYVVRTFVRNPAPPTLALIVRVMSVLIGAYFIRGASLLVRFAYPESTPEPTDKTSV
jgi:hypothetical protein